MKKQHTSKSRISFLLLLTILISSVVAQAQPVITTFAPASGGIGSSVNITGTGFNPTAAQNIVFFGATQATVTAATATSLTVTVPLGATYQYLSVTNLAVNLTAYSAKPFIVTLAGSTSFEPKVDFATGSQPWSVNIGDIDGDGKTDLALANSGSTTVSVLRNNSTPGTISYATKVDFTTGTGPVSVSIGDINGDGKPDLAAANFNSSTVSVLRNNSTPGTVSFATKVDFTTGTNPFSVTIGDIDGDGRPDLAVANSGGNTVSVLRNTSTPGTMSFATKLDFPTGVYPRSVNIGDIDGDGKTDLAVANFNSNTVSVLRNTSTPGTVSFAAKLDFTTGFGPRSVDIGDIDGDGKPDLAVSSDANFISVFRNTSTSGTVSFATKVNLLTGVSPRSISIGDIDGDGKPDLAVANYNTNSVSVLRNTSISGTISFANKVDFVIGINPNSANSVSIGEIDGDGRPDLTVANFGGNTVSVLRQTGLICIAPTVPTLSASSTINCGTVSTTLSIASGTLNDATLWQWYSSSCGGTPVGTGTSVIVSPAATTTYFARGEGGCVTPGSCSSITITVNPSPAPIITAGGPTSFCAGSSTLLTARSGVIAIAAAVPHSLFLKDDGTVWATGYNAKGQLGDGTTTSRNAPVQVSGLSSITSITAGTDHSLFLKHDGTVWATGWNGYGQLGDGTNTDRTTPVQVSGLSGITAIKSGWNHSLFLKNDGTVWATGRNNFGQLGDGTNTDRTTPVQVSGLSGITAIAGGQFHSLFLKNDGTVWATGQNDVGQLGDGTNTDRTTPVQANGVSGIAFIASGNDHSLFLKHDGTVWATGHNDVGQLSNGNATFITTPFQMSGITGITAIAGGAGHCLFLKNDSTVWATGWNINGQLGDGSNTNRSNPVQVMGLSSVTAIAGGWRHSLFLKHDGTAWATGYNFFGQLGDGTTTDRTTPVQVSGFDVSVTAHQWYIGGSSIAGATTSTYTATTAGSYTVQATNSNGCSATSAPIIITVNAPPTPTITAGGPTTFCSGGSVTIGASSYAMQFNATGQYLTAPHIPAIDPLNAITLEAWVKIDNTSGVKYIISKGINDADPGHYGLLIINNNVQFMVQIGAGGVNSIGSVLPNVWTHLAGTWDGFTLKLYINGVLDNTKAYAGPKAANANPLLIGWLGLMPCCPYQMQGSIDEVRIWNTERSNSQIVSGMQSEIPASSSGLVAYYKFNEGSSGVTADATANANTATLAGSPQWSLSTAPLFASYLWSDNSSFTSINATTSGNYYVTVTDANGCTGTASIKVTKKAKPTVTVTPSAAVICPPNVSVSLTAGGTASTYAWSPATGLNLTAGASVTASPTATTTYIVTGTSTAGCTATKTATVTVKPKPVNLSTSNITASSAITKWDTVACAVGYKLQYRKQGVTAWTSNNINSNSPTKTISGLLAASSYQWRVKSKFADGTFSVNSNIASFTTLVLRSGMETIESTNELVVYPNPATDKLNLEFPFTEGDANVTIINALGQTVLTQKNNDAEGSIEINIQSLTEGLYFITVKNGDNTFNSRFVKK